MLEKEKIERGVGMSIKKQNNNKSNLAKILLIAFLVINAFLGYKIISLENKYTEIYKEVIESRMANEKVLAMLKEVRDKQEQQSEDIQRAMNVAYRKKISKQNVIQLKSSGMNIYTDLGYCSELSVDEINKIIDYYHHVSLSPEQIRASIAHLSWNNQMKQVLNETCNPNLRIPYR